MFLLWENISSFLYPGPDPSEPSGGRPRSRADEEGWCTGVSGGQEQGRKLPVEGKVPP